MLLNYAHTYTNNANMRYYASNMILHVELDASYLFMALSLSHIAGHYYLFNMIPTLLTLKLLRPMEQLYQNVRIHDMYLDLLLKMRQEGS